MKKIGEGWQYSVYDLGNGRVLKKFHSLPKSYWVILKTIFPFREDSLFDIPGFSRGMKRQALASFGALKRRDIPPEWICNPHFLNDVDFEQDKVIPISELLNDNLPAGKKIIDDFISFNKRLIGKGIIDKSFNITKNFGINNSGDIVLIDIGELFDDPEKIRKQIEQKAWAKHYVAGEIKNDELRRYFLEAMDRIL